MQHGRDQHGTTQGTRGRRAGPRGRPPRSTRGFMMIDVMLGLTMLGVLLAVMAMAANQTRQGSRELGDQRAAQRVAQEVLMDLRLGRPSPAARGNNLGVELVRLGPAAQTRGQAWFEVRVRQSRQTARLVGLAPDASALAPAPPSGNGSQGGVP